jgi:hypothetical protein
MNRKIKTSEIAFLLVPVIFLVGAGIFLRGRSSTPTESKLSVSDIKFRRLPNRGAKSGRVGITVFVRYEGQEPKWWQKGVRDQRLQNMRFVNQKGKEYSLYSFGGGPGAYDAAQQSHVLEYTCTVPDGYDITKPGHFKGTAVFADQLIPLKPLGVARFSVPVQLP